jgi:hypothetical protein
VTHTQLRPSALPPRNSTSCPRGHAYTQRPLVFCQRGIVIMKDVLETVQLSSIRVQSLKSWAEVVTTIIPSMFGLLPEVGCGRGLPVRGSVTQVCFIDFFVLQRTLYKLIILSPGVAVAILGVCLISTFNVSRSLEVSHSWTPPPPPWRPHICFSPLSIAPIPPCAGYLPCCGRSKRCAQ